MFGPRQLDRHQQHSSDKGEAADGSDNQREDLNAQEKVSKKRSAD